MGNFTWKQRYFSIFRKFKYLSSNVLLIIFSIIQWFLPQKWSQIWHFFSDFWDSASLIDSLFRCRNPHSVISPWCQAKEQMSWPNTYSSFLKTNIFSIWLNSWNISTICVPHATVAAVSQSLLMYFFCSKSSFLCRSSVNLASPLETDICFLAATQTT